MDNTFLLGMCNIANMLFTETFWPIITINSANYNKVTKNLETNEYATRFLPQRYLLYTL